MKKHLDPKNLPYAGALVQAVLFSIAGQDFFPRAGWLVGLGVGAVVNYSIALASSRINDIAERRKGLARLSLACMLLLSPATITLSLFSPASIFTAISWAVCVDLSIVLAGSITGKTMIQESTPKLKPAKQPQRSRSKVAQRSLSELGCRYAGAGCDRKFASQNAANAHARSCGFKPTIAMPVDVSDNTQRKG